MTETEQYKGKVEIRLGDELVLREFRVSDRFDIADLARTNPEQVNLYAPALLKELSDPDKVAEWLQGKPDAATREQEFGLWLQEQLLGGWSLRLNARGDAASISYWLGKDYEGKGYATKSSEAMIAYAFIAFPQIEAIQALTTEDNHRSQKLMGRLGLIGGVPVELEGESYLAYMLKKGNWHGSMRKDDHA